MDIKAIVCDLDGTLLASDHVISEYTAEIIRKVREKGVEVFIATGRHFNDAFAFRDRLNLDSFLITSNGAKVHDVNNKEVISNNISADIVKELLDMYIDNEVLINIYENDIWYTNRESEYLKDFYQESGFKCIIRPDIENLKGIEATKFFYLVDSERYIDKLSFLELELNFQFSDRINITYSFPTCLEVMKKGVSKGSTITELLAQKNIPLENTIAFGDGLNDYEMLSVVGKGLIMGNGVAELKQKLPHNKVIGANTEDGLAKYLAEHVLQIPLPEL